MLTFFAAVVAAAPAAALSRRMLLMLLLMLFESDGTNSRADAPPPLVDGQAEAVVGDGGGEGVDYPLF